MLTVYPTTDEDEKQRRQYMNSNKLVACSAALKTFPSRTSIVSSHPISGPNSLLNAQENVFIPWTWLSTRFYFFFWSFPRLLSTYLSDTHLSIQIVSLGSAEHRLHWIVQRQLLLKPMKKSSLGVICVFPKDGWLEILTRNTNIKWHAGWFSISMEFWESIFLVRSFQLIKPTVQQKLLVMLKNSYLLVCLYRISNSILSFWHTC